MRRVIFIIVLLISIGVYAADWTHVYFRNAAGKVRVRSVAPSGMDIVTFEPTVDSTAYSCMQIDYADGGVESIELSCFMEMANAPHVPVMRIDVESGANVTSKNYYMSATVCIDGKGYCQDFAPQEVLIKGRGNNTWVFPKKPYRLKFDKKQQLGTLPHRGKSYVLLANMLDPSLMRTAVAFKIAEMCGLQYTNHIMPVEVEMNGKPLGSYMLTEKIGINGASVDVDEDAGVLLELDTYYDEQYEFRDRNYNLPVMIKDPDLQEMVDADETGELSVSGLIGKWEDDFNRFTDAASGKSGQHWSELLDMESLLDYVFVYALTNNHEICHPKSVYMYKAQAGDKYMMGPVWDFDWAFTFLMAGESANTYKTPLFCYGGFFSEICSDAGFMERFRHKIADFYANDFSALLDYVDEYASQIRASAYVNGEIWPKGCYYNEAYPNLGSSEEFDRHHAALKQFLIDRMELMLRDEQCGLYKAQ